MSMRWHLFGSWCIALFLFLSPRLRLLRLRLLLLCSHQPLPCYYAGVVSAWVDQRDRLNPCRWIQPYMRSTLLGDSARRRSFDASYQEPIVVKELALHCQHIPTMRAGAMLSYASLVVLFISSLGFF